MTVMDFNRLVIIISLVVVILATAFYYHMFEKTRTYRTLEENKDWVHHANTNRN